MPRILVIDDDPDAVLMLLALLRLEGFDATGYASAREALRTLQDIDPDVVVCDLSMPMVSGWDFARAVRRIMGRERPVLISVSGQYKRPSDEFSARAAGFDHYLTKPFDANEILDLIGPLR
jgi:two-component system CheB/CheR fusion protein